MSPYFLYKRMLTSVDEKAKLFIVVHFSSYVYTDVLFTLSSSLLDAQFTKSEQSINSYIEGTSCRLWTLALC